jgi:hypothetical protein
LGHASIKLTMDLYGHLFDGSDRESAERMQKLFGVPDDTQAASSSEKAKVIVLGPRKTRRS